MDENQVAFHLEEYKSLKSEVENRIKSTERIEFIVLGGLAAFYAWLSKEGTAPAFVWWIPVGLVTLGAARQLALLYRIMQVTAYISTIEHHLCAAEPPGWETHLKNLRKTPKGHLISISGYGLWVVLLVVTIVLAFNGGLFVPPSGKP